jgi:hypothetical protein
MDRMTSEVDPIRGGEVFGAIRYRAWRSEPAELCIPSTATGNARAGKENASVLTAA